MVVAENIRKAVGLKKTSSLRRGFTLVEMLIVIGVLLLLLAILLPAMKGVREGARALQCQNNLRQLGQAFIGFAADHDQTLPGGFYDQARPDPSQRDWLQGSSTDWHNAPTTGTIYAYVGQNAMVYRCPSLDPDPHRPYASNGIFDYTLFLSFTGARLTNVRPTSQFRYPDGHTVIVPTPILTEEDPWFTVNKTTAVGGSHVDTDRLSHTHRGRCYYWSVDGSVASFDEPEGANTYNWTSQSPRRKWVTLGLDVTYGWWNHQ